MKYFIIVFMGAPTCSRTPSVGMSFFFIMTVPEDFWNFLLCFDHCLRKTSLKGLRLLRFLVSDIGPLKHMTFYVVDFLRDIGVTFPTMKIHWEHDVLISLNEEPKCRVWILPTDRYRTGVDSETWPEMVSGH